MKPNRLINLHFHKCGIMILAIFCLASISQGQTPSDALTMSKRELCLATIYQHDTWNKYWEGTLLRENLNIGTLTRTTISPMIGYGLHDRFNIFLTLPYVRTSASGGQMAGVSGWQDISLAAKFKVYDSEAFQFFTSASFSMPVTDYLSDYMPLNLGLGTQEGAIRGILKYEYQSKVYLRASGAYIFRNTTEAERNYYYDNQGYYTSTMDVPNVISWDAALGAWFLSNKLQAEFNMAQQIGRSGDDIRRQNAPQPTNRMDYTNVAGYVRYFPGFFSGASILCSYSQVLDGRNFGQSRIISGGITYQFSTKKSTNP